MKKNQTKLFIVLLKIIVIGLILFPFILLATFNHPVADDYVYYNLSVNKNIYEYVSTIYKSWTGRYSQLSMIYFVNQFNLLKAAKLLPIILILLNVHAVYYYFRITTNYLYNKLNCYLVSLIVNFIFYSQMPNISEGLYWISGITTYFISWILIIYFLSYLIKYKQSGTFSGIEKILITLLVITIPGFNESSLLFINIVWFLFLFFNYKIVIKDYFVIFLISCTIVFSLISILAPGNYLRIQIESANNIYNTDVIQKKNITLAIWNSINLFVSYFLKYWYVFSFLFSVLTVILINKRERKFINKFNIKNQLFENLLAFISIPILAFPAYWGTNYFQPRLGNLVLCIMIILFLSLVVRLIVLFNLKIIKYKNIFAIILLISSFFFIKSVVYDNRNYKIALYDILKGRAAAYDKEFDNRYKKFLPNKDIKVDPIINKCPSLYHGDITMDSTNWINRGTSQYFNLKSLIIINSQPTRF